MTAYVAALGTNDGSQTPFAPVCDAVGNLYYADISNGNIYRSINNGSTWSAITKPSGFTAPNVYTTGCCSPVDGTIYYISAGTVIKSTNNGSTWTLCTSFGTTTTRTSICDNNGVVFVIDGNGVCKYSNNNCASWTALTTITYCSSMCLDPINNVVYAAKNSGNIIYKITTAGTSTLTTFASTRYLFNITYLNGNLYVSGSESGVGYVWKTSVTTISWSTFVTLVAVYSGFLLANTSVNTIMLGDASNSRNLIEITESGTVTSYGAGYMSYAYYNNVDGCIYVANSISSSSAPLMYRSGVTIPVASPVGGTYTTSQTVTLTSVTSGATIYYTIDGTTPTTSSSVYSSALTVSTNETIKAIAYKSGYTSSGVRSNVYVINNKTIHVGYGGTWHTVTASYIGSGGVWKLAPLVYAGSGGIWK